MSIQNSPKTPSVQTEPPQTGQPQQPKADLPRWVGWELLFILVVVSLFWRLAYLSENAFDYDEGHWLMFGMLAAEGFKPYTEIFVGIPPTALLTIQTGAALFGATWNVRIPMLLYSLVGVISIFWLVKQQPYRQATVAALLAAIFLSFGPRYFAHSVSIMAEVPAVALALLSLALAQQYQSARKYYWLILSGIAFALSLTLKVFVVFLPFIIGLQFLLIAFAPGKSAGFKNVLSRPAAYQQLAKMVLAWGGGVILVFGLFFIVYDPAALYRQVVSFRLALRELPLFSGERLDDVLGTWGEESNRYRPLVMMSLLYFLLHKPRRWLKAWPWLAWLVLAYLFLFTHDPLRRRHVVIVLPPLAALSAIGLSQLLAYLYQTLSAPIGKLQTIIIALLLVWMLFLPWENIDDFSREDFNLDRRPDLKAVTGFIESTTALDDYVLVDDQRFALYTDRLVPPFLAETSLARIRIGWITTEDILHEAARYHVPFLMITAFRFHLIPGVYDAVAERYAVQIGFYDEDAGKTMTVYTIETDTGKTPDHPLQTSLGGQVFLKGADFSPFPWWAGDEISISTYWQAQTTIDKDYKIFLHLLNAGGELAAQFDHYPFQITLQPTIQTIHLNPQYQQYRPQVDLTTYPNTGLVPTSVWLEGQTLRDTITVSLPDTLPAGAYTLYGGLYDEAGGERLPVDPVNGQPDGQTAVLLGQVEVLAR